MSDLILVLNLGSSSLKFTLYAMENNKLERKLSGNSENIGIVERSQIKIKDESGKSVVKVALEDHKDALIAVFDQLEVRGFKQSDIKAVGHRVVHGGDKYADSVLIDDNVLKQIEELIPIAPLHNPVNLKGIVEAKKILDHANHVAVFDTAFHNTLPEYAFKYAVPKKWYDEYGVRRYGFHGTSHKYVSRRACAILSKNYDAFNAITVHLGNGSSIAKIENGKSVDTSMGFTPLEGVIMGTRSGDIDAALIEHVATQTANEEGITLDESYQKTLKALNKESGLLALSGTNLMQDIRKKALEGDEASKMVVDTYAYRIAKYIGAYAAGLPSLDAIVFCAGVGENEAYVRQRVLEMLRLFDFEIDEKTNCSNEDESIIAKSKVFNTKAMMVPTDEEIIIGYDTMYLGCLKENIPQKYPFEG